MRLYNTPPTNTLLDFKIVDDYEQLKRELGDDGVLFPLLGTLVEGQEIGSHSRFH